MPLRDGPIIHIACLTCVLALVAGGCSENSDGGAAMDTQAAREVVTKSQPLSSGRSRNRVATSPAPTTFVGSKACAECHSDVYLAWQGSHHDLAMQHASKDTVLGDFDDARFTHFGVTTRFHQHDGHFLVNTEGPDGVLRDYDITFTFGVHPLQQYLVQFPHGRYQVLNIGWDTRSKEEGGQRWFHLYPDAAIRHDDDLHWTRLNQNWNFMCAECHSTNLQKNYDLESNSYATTSSEMNVACEACHGPGSDHVAWAETAAFPPPGGTSDDVDPEALAPGHLGQHVTDPVRGLTFRLKEPEAGRWLLNQHTMKYERSPPLTSDIQLDTCARCHSRRHLLHEPYVHGQRLMDTHQPAILADPLYEVDGQIHDEVYVYGSFIQSKMYHKGVRCTDCHDPHHLDLHVPDNALCTRCHVSDQFDTPRHHFHEVGSEGANCIACHMAAQHYMVIDKRHDHSFRIPRPDLSARLGTPNTCNDCHDDQDTQWAADAVVRWYGPDRPTSPHYGEILAAGRRGRPGSRASLARLARNRTVPGIVRATAISLMGSSPDAAWLEAVTTAVNDPDPLVRVHALNGMEVLHPAQRIQLAGARLSDPVRAVRIEAAHVLAGTTAQASDYLRAPLHRAVAEYFGAQLSNADRAEGRFNMGNMYRKLGEPDKAESAYQAAIRIDPTAIQALVNLADLHRELGREEACEATLRKAVEKNSNNAPVQHALGLALIRQNRLVEAIDALAEAASLAPDHPHFSFVHAVALNSADRYPEAIQILNEAIERHPYDRDILILITTMSRDRGHFDTALDHARRLVELFPQEERFRKMLETIEKQLTSKP